ncbi:MAG TPA: hypothetical protein VLA29_06885 [Acidimicrobiia bacterium]|nr:hypothetical protein [Acidimicrobiia bacterium]
MTTLRQRLLLVAGWLAAAVGAGLVASGAVAVAGGQVLDRPLRPMTAAEVAALPVDEVGTSGVIEPHASGGFGQTTPEPTSGSDEAVDGRVDPTGAGRSSASTSEPEDDPFVSSTSTSVVRVVSVVGGTASFAVVDDSLTLLWATPQPGYVATTRRQSRESITIAFSSNRGVWVVEATSIDGTITADSRPEPIT